MIQSFKLNDPYLSMDGGHTIGFAYNPLTDSMFTSYLNQTGSSYFQNLMAEYKIGGDGEYHLVNRYDLESVGIYTSVLSMDIDQSTGVFYLQENNTRVVRFALDDLAVAAIPEAKTYLMMLAGLGALGIAIRRRRKDGMI